MPRVAILIVAALIVALTAVVVRNKLSGMKGDQPKVATNRILVAKRDISPGKFVDAAIDLDWAAPATEPPEGEVIREGANKKSEFNGGVVRRPLKAGKPVLVDEITKAGDGGFLSAVLEPGMRAVAIAVTATTGAAGFIAPGDRVDLIVTHRIKTARSETSGDDTVISETFVRDVRVVAVDQSLDTPDNNKAQLAKNVTVEVNESQAEQIAVATEMGKISMALRSALLTPQGEVAGHKSTGSSDVIPSLSRKATVAPHVQVIRGDEKEDLQFLREGGN